MSNIGWENCPEAVKHKIDKLLAGLMKELKGNIRGIYLHGSLAMRCFNPTASDIDLLALTHHRIPLLTKKTLAQMCLSISGAPHPIEISLIRQDDLIPWKYPTPFEFHFSEAWRGRFSKALATGKGKLEQPLTDTDLAAHITVTRHRGICLWGAPIGEAFPDVPNRDFLASVVSDLEWTLERLDQISVTGVLNSCRVLAYLKDRQIFSKEEGGVWALNTLPVEFHPVVKESLGIYRGEHLEHNVVDLDGAKRLIENVISLEKESF